MRRKQATALIDEIRVLALTEPAETGRKLGKLLARFGLQPLEPCPGEAHLTGEGRANGMIDHCHCCAPRWGWVGPVEVVS